MTRRAITLATKAKLKALKDPDPFLVEVALALARAMDEEPSSANSKELCRVIDLLTTQTNNDATKLDALFSGAPVGDPENPVT